MLNIQTFSDIDGNAVEIDRRNVIDAYVDGTHKPGTIVIVAKGGPAWNLGIGARSAIESWLGRALGVITRKGTNVITSGDLDMTKTDEQARAIMERLATQGVTEETVARTPYGILVSMILNALWETIDEDMKAEAGARPAPSNTNEITSYAHCGRCLAERPDDQSPAEYARLAVGWTPIGLQV
jgi:hypothetical protein